MSEDFQQTVDLRKKTEKQKPPVSPLEKIYQTEAAGGPGQDFKKINQPKSNGVAPERLIKIIVLLLAVLVVSGTVYFLYFRHPGNLKTITQAQNWYAVKLVDGTVYYGQIFDTKAEPVMIKNVYYNYDQAKVVGAVKDQTKTIEETGSIRLVKRGQETQGGDGSMLVYHVNILLLEALRPDSKVLKAILEYEK